ncbi:MAG: PIN domain-containing protein [Acidimicrobiales bacterium]
MDASVLVAELLRQRGRALFVHPDLRCVVAEEQWAEAEHELGKRVATIVGQGRLTSEQARALHEGVHALVDDRAIEVIPRPFYEHIETIARRRVPRDPNDWPTVALALVLDAGILTGDNDFLGCGCSTWTVETLRAVLAEPWPEG